MPVYAKRTGSFFGTVHLRGTVPMPIRDYEELPQEGDMACVLPINDIYTAYGRDVIWIDPPSNNPVDNARVSDETIAQTLKVDVAASKQRPPTTTPQETFSIETLLREFQLLFKEDKNQAAVVGTFLINTFPDLEEKLKAAASNVRKERKKFEL